MVHSRQSRKTHSSTLSVQYPTTQAPASVWESTLAVADFEYRDPLLPRLVWP